MAPGVFRVAFIVISLCLMVSSGLSEYEHPSTLIAIYMVGSNLECEGTYCPSYATANLREIGSTWENLSSSGSQRPDLLIAYGGSQRKGWEGMTIINGSELTLDLENGVIGDETLYQYRDPSVSMGAGSTLETFLAYIRSEPAYDRYILIFWDHGSGYAGLCIDNNHQDDLLTLNELKASLTSSGIHWDVIGMDACTMGMYEVASALSGSADYLIASEDNIPSQGFNYPDSLTSLVMNPQIPAEQWGRAVVDAYMDSRHDQGSPKTMSVIDLHAIPELTSALNDTSKLLSKRVTGNNMFRIIGRSIVSTKGYPQRQKDQSGYYAGIDLKDFLNQTSAFGPDEQSAMEHLSDAFSRVVIYERHSAMEFGSHGLSIASPGHSILGFDAANRSSGDNQTWYGFISRYNGVLTEDTTPPVISAGENGTYHITDDYGLADVSMMVIGSFDEQTRINLGGVIRTYSDDPVIRAELHALNRSKQAALITDSLTYLQTNPYLIEHKIEPVYPVGTDTYQPDPDGDIFYLTTNHGGIIVPLFCEYIGRNEENKEQYRTNALVLKNSTITSIQILFFAEPGEGTVTNITCNTFHQDDAGNTDFSRSERYLPEDGDVIFPMVNVVGLDKGGRLEVSSKTYIPCAVSGEIEIKRYMLPAGSYSMALKAKDFRGNTVWSPDLIKLRFPNYSGESWIDDQLGQILSLNA